MSEQWTPAELEEAKTLLNDVSLEPDVQDAKRERIEAWCKHFTSLCDLFVLRVRLLDNVIEAERILTGALAWMQESNTQLEKVIMDLERPKPAPRGRRGGL